MDAVRFGRALGLGARQAAKTVISAVDAARAENPSGPTPAARPASASSANRASSTAGSSVPRTSSAVVGPPAAMPNLQRRATDPAPNANRAAKSVARAASGGAAQVRGVKEGFARFRDSTVEPVVRLSGVLWLELTGVFFGIFALSTGVAIWRLRGQWRPALAHPVMHAGLLVAVAVFALFAYFCISSFVRARRRERRRG